MKIPSMILRQLYTYGSLENVDEGVRFSLKNRLSDAKVTRLGRVAINGAEVPLDLLTLELTQGRLVPARAVSPDNPLEFPLREVVHLRAVNGFLDAGKHRIDLAFDATPFGRLQFHVEDAIAADRPQRVSVPYDKDDDYGEEIVARRRAFVEEFTGVRIRHLDKHSFSAEMARGNIENFTGVAQVPIGFAGPIRIHGEHAVGDFLIPMATTEGTLVASYNRGMKVVNLSGGVTTTISADFMQRAPVFVFDSAREARDFRQWVADNLAEIREHAEATSHVAKLQHIEVYLANKFAYLRFNYTTGDAAGQNMVGRATFAACSWILEHVHNVRKFYLESNLATDKKASQVNMMRTRGKRVTAEAVIPRRVLVENMRVEPESLHYHAGVANIGAFLSGANNNGGHSPNGITAMFIATGQDVANVSESSAGIIYSEITPAGDLYLSITIPSLIVATYGGGTGLPTQRECLEILGCHGKGKVHKLAEIVAAVVLAGELSLGAAISSSDWVSSHEKYGRNR